MIILYLKFYNCINIIIIFPLTENENQDSLGSHQQESEYIETFAKPVQRHMDSLKRQHNIKTRPREFIEPKVEENENELCTTPIPATRFLFNLNIYEVKFTKIIF